MAGAVATAAVTRARTSLAGGLAVICRLRVTLAHAEAAGDGDAAAAAIAADTDDTANDDSREAGVPLHPPALPAGVEVAAAAAVDREASFRRVLGLIGVSLYRRQLRNRRLTPVRCGRWLRRRAAALWRIPALSRLFPESSSSSAAAAAAAAAPQGALQCL